MPGTGYAVCLNADNTLLASPFDEAPVYAAPVTWLGDTLYGLTAYGTDGGPRTGLYVIGTVGAGPFQFARPGGTSERIIASVAGDFTAFLTTVDDGLEASDGNTGLWKAIFAAGVYQSSEVGVVTESTFVPHQFVDSKGRPQFQVVRNDVPNLGLVSVRVGDDATAIATFDDTTENAAPAYDGIVVTPQTSEG